MTLLKHIGFEIDIPDSEAGEADDTQTNGLALQYITGNVPGDTYRSTGVGRVGGGSFNSSGQWIVDVDGSPSEIWMQIWIHRPSGGQIVDARTADMTGLLHFRDTNGAIMFTFGIEDDAVGEHLLIRRGNVEGTILDTSTLTFVRGQDALFHIHYLADNTSGEIEVYRDGTLILEFSGDSTAGLTTIGEIHFGILEFLDGAISKGSTGLFEFDDFALDDTGFPNDLTSKLINISGDGNYTEWDIAGDTPAATTWQSVDDANDGGAPDDDTTLISTAVNDERSSVANTDGFSESNEGVAAVKVISRVGGPTDEDMLFFLRINGTDYDGTQFTPAGWSLEYDMWVTNPDTGLAWAEGEIVDIEAGVQQKAQ